MNPVKVNLLNSLRDHSAKIGILGLGYVGLPLATAFGEAGFQIIGIDPDPRKVNALNKGESYVQDVSDKQIDQPVEDRESYLPPPIFQLCASAMRSASASPPRCGKPVTRTCRSS